MGEFGPGGEGFGLLAPGARRDARKARRGDPPDDGAAVSISAPARALVQGARAKSPSDRAADRMLQGTVFWAVAGARSPGRQRRWWRRRSRVSRRRGGVRARRRCAVRARGRRRAAPGAPASWPRGRDEGGRHRMPRGGTCREDGLTHGPLGSSAYQAPSGTTRICAIIAPGSLAVEEPGGDCAPVPFTDESEQPVGSRPAAAVVVMDEGVGDNVLLDAPLCGQDRHGRTGHLRGVGSPPRARRQFSGGEAGAVLGTGGRRPGADRSYGRGRLRAECVADAEPAEAGASAGETCRDGAEIE